jgi:Rrf2 family protein
MLRLSKRTEHGLRAAVQLARLDSSGYVQSRDLAAAEDLPTKFLESILLTLRRGGVLESKVGSGGGYRLARPAEQIIVLALLELLQLDDAPTATDTPGGRAVMLLQDQLRAAAQKTCGELTLRDLADQADPAAEAMYHI